MYKCRSKRSTKAAFVALDSHLLLPDARAMPSVQSARRDAHDARCMALGASPCARCQRCICQVGRMSHALIFLQLLLIQTQLFADRYFLTGQKR